jgi:hypothetical protein
MFDFFRTAKYVLTEEEAQLIADLIEDLIEEDTLEFVTLDKLTMIQAKLPGPSLPNNVIEFRPRTDSDDDPPFAS